MLDTTSLAVSKLVAHGHINPETQRELQLTPIRVLNNAPVGITVPQKQLALIMALEELTKQFPPDNPLQNTLAVMVTLILGPRLLTAVSSRLIGEDEASILQ